MSDSLTKGNQEHDGGPEYLKKKKETLKKNAFLWIVRLFSLFIYFFFAIGFQELAWIL